MFSFECRNLHKENLQSEPLKTIEYICDQFHLQDAFGIISTALHDILDQIILLSKDSMFETSLHFMLEHLDLTIQIEHSESLDELNNLLTEEELDLETPGFVITSLVDQIEFLNENKCINLLFHVKPYMQGRREGTISENKLTTKKTQEIKRS